MAYVRAEGTVIVSDCPGAVPTAGWGAFGAVEGSSVADVRGQLVALESQINRFLEPEAARLGPTVHPTGSQPLPVTGELSLTYRIYLQGILTNRATSGIYGNVPADQLQVLGQAVQVLDPNYVIANLPAVLALVKNYADSLGLSAAKAPPLSATTMNKLIVAAVAVGIFFFARKR